MTDVRARPVAALPLVPAAAFVLVWSSGYISGPYGVEHVAPFTLLALRFAVAAVLAPVSYTHLTLPTTPYV